MVSIIKPNSKVVTKDGECEITISIELNINLNSNGLTVNAQAIPQTPMEVKTSQVHQMEEPTNWVIPDFDDLKKVQFGKGT